MSKRYKALRRERRNIDRGLRNGTSVIGEMPHDGRNWECQCGRCGSSMDGESCERCSGEGWTDYGELYEEDPLWYDIEDIEPCHACNGEGAWVVCISSPKWCLNNPLPGRGKIPRGMPEWFTFSLIEHHKEMNLTNAIKNHTRRFR